MTVNEIKPKNRTVLLAIDQHRTYTAYFGLIEDKSEFLIYIKFTTKNLDLF